MMTENDVDSMEDAYRLWMRNKHKMIKKITLCIWWVYKPSQRIITEGLLPKENRIMIEHQWRKKITFHNTKWATVRIALSIFE